MPRHLGDFLFQHLATLVTGIFCPVQIPFIYHFLEQLCTESKRRKCIKLEYCANDLLQSPDSWLVMTSKRKTQQRKNLFSKNILNVDLQECFTVGYHFNQSQSKQHNVLPKQVKCAHLKLKNIYKWRQFSSEKCWFVAIQVIIVVHCKRSIYRVRTYRAFSAYNYAT